MSPAPNSLLSPEVLIFVTLWLPLTLAFTGQCSCALSSFCCIKQRVTSSLCAILKCGLSMSPCSPNTFLWCIYKPKPVSYFYFIFLKIFFSKSIVIYNCFSVSVVLEALPSVSFSMWLQICLQDGAKKDSSGQEVMRAVISPLCFPIPHLEDRAKLPPPSILECLCRQAISSLPPSLPFFLQCLDMPTSYCCLAPLQIPASFWCQNEGKRQSACFGVPQSIVSVLVSTPQEGEAWQLEVACL